MKKAIFIRHAKSSWQDPSLKDINRPLNDRGIRDAPFMAQVLKGKGIVPQQIISSPAKRALTTATYFAKTYSIPPEQIVVEPKIYEAYIQDVLHIVHHLPNNYDTVLLFGHNPTFTSIANLFTQGYIPNVPTCGIIQVEASITDWAQFDKQHAKLTAFHYPKQYQ